MEKFIKDLKNLNKTNEDIINEIKTLQKLLEEAKKAGEESTINFLQEKINKLQKENNINNNLNELLKKIKDENTSSIPLKLSDEVKEEFKRISKELNIKQGELLGLLITVFVNEYNKQN